MPDLTDAERVEYLHQAEGEETVAPTEDPKILAALRLVDHYGFYYDPVLSPETLIEIVTLVLDG